MRQNYTGIIGEALTLISRKHDSKNKVPKVSLIPLQIHLQIFSAEKNNHLYFHDDHSHQKCTTTL